MIGTQLFAVSFIFPDLFGAMEINSLYPTRKMLSVLYFASTFAGGGAWEPDIQNVRGSARP